jgi:hypothetical protein
MCGSCVVFHGKEGKVKMTNIKPMIKILAVMTLIAFLLPIPYFILLQRMSVRIFKDLPFFLANPEEDVIILGACFVDWILWLAYAVIYTVLLLVIFFKVVGRELRKW